jgi:hypothetical protein
LAFVKALQSLPARQRAILILRDVLSFSAKEVSHILDTSEESVSSALKRARAALSRHSEAAEHEPPPMPGSPAEYELVERFTRAFEAADVAALVALLTDDALLVV